MKLNKMFLVCGLFLSLAAFADDEGGEEEFPEEMDEMDAQESVFCCEGKNGAPLFLTKKFLQGKTESNQQLCFSQFPECKPAEKPKKKK